MSLTRPAFASKTAFFWRELSRESQLAVLVDESSQVTWMVQLSNGLDATNSPKQPLLTKSEHWMLTSCPGIRSGNRIRILGELGIAQANP